MTQTEQAPADEECKQGAVARVRLERVGKPPAQSKEPEGVAVAGPGGAMVKGAQRHARKPETPTAKPSMIITPDWCIYPQDDCVLVIHKDAQTGFRLDAEAAAIIAIGAP